MPVHWKSEACDQPLDPVTGVFSVRLTQAAMHSINIYCEQPYTSPDGRRIAIMRSVESDPRIPPYELLVADVYSYRSTSIEKEATSQFVGTASWSGWIYYTNRYRELARFNLTTLEKEILWTRWPFSPDFVFQSVSPDLRYLIGVQFTADFTSEIVRIDLAAKTWKVIYTGKECLGHLQFNPSPRKPGQKHDILVQQNRRDSYNHMWEHKAVENPLSGATHFIIDEDGQNERPLPIGEPYTQGSFGHASWRGDVGRVAIASQWDFVSGKLDPRWPQGNLFDVGPNETKPKVFVSPDQRPNHVNVSKCGRYFVTDSYGKGVTGAPIAIYVGDLVSGKGRELLSDCKAHGGGGACSHPHAYFTADNKHVIYNADQFLLGQVYAARVPEGFLASLA